MIAINKTSTVFLSLSVAFLFQPVISLQTSATITTGNIFLQSNKILLKTFFPGY